MMHRSLSSAFLACLLFLGAPFAAAQAPMRVEVSIAQPDGSILVAGQATTSGLPRRITVGRYFPNGAIDTAFIGGGWLNYDAAPEVLSEFRVTAIALQADGKIVLALVQDGVNALLRLEAGGAPDWSFGQGPQPGLSVDSASSGMRINALVARYDGILAIGSYSGAFTSNVRQSAVARYQPWGQRDTNFGPGPDGVKIPMFAAGDNELRAVVTASDGTIYAAGYTSDFAGGERNFLAGSFRTDGEPNFGFGSGGKVSINTFSGRDDEAFAIGWGPYNTLVLAGRNGHTLGMYAQSWFTLAALSTYGYLDYSFGYGGVAYAQVPIPTTWEGDATASSVSLIPGGGDLLAAGTVVNITTGRAHFALWRLDRDYMEPYAWGPIAGPVTADDDLMKAAYASGEQIVAVGTRESLQGEKALRLRYFADTGEFDTDFATEGEDSTPNPFAFDAYYSRVDAGYQADSQPARISGINAATPISVTGGQYWIGCPYSGTWASDPGFVTNGQRVCLRVTAASTPDTTTTATLSVGGLQASFSVATGFVSDTTIDSHPPGTGNATAQFTYSWDRVSGNPSYYECRLDAAAFAQCPFNGITYTGLEQGSHTFEARTVNSWGTDPTPASYTWNVAGVPDTAITSSPAYYFNQTAASLSFTSPDPAATFECRLNGAAFATCSSPKIYSGLGAGGYTFEVRARNLMGADPTPAQAQWIVDTTAPDTTITGSTPSNGTPYGVNSLVVQVDSNDPTAHFEYSLDGAPFVSTGSPVYLNGIANGNHTFAARAVDPAGNPDPTPVQRSFSVDTTPPETVITGGPGAISTSPQASFFLSPFSNQIAMDCTLDGAPRQCSIGTNDLYGLRDGTHVFVATARRISQDAAGTSMWLVDPTPESRTWVVDLPPPETSLYAPSGSVSSNSAQITFSSDNYPVTFECSFNGAAWSACSGEVLLSNLADGTYTFAVRSSTATKVDPTPATNTWTVDLTPPQTVLTDGPQGTVSSTSATLVFAADESGASFYCGLDGAPLTPCLSPKIYAGLAAGGHTFNVLARDAAGNYALQGAVRTWTIDLTVPDTTITVAPSGTVAQASATVEFTSSDATAGFECSLDGAAYATCATPLNLTGLADGSHSLLVRARDPAGNVDLSPEGASWTVDTTAPDTSVTSGPSGTVAQASASFTFTSLEATATFECSLDAAAFTPCASAVSYAGLAEGMHMFEVRARDTLGNADATPASRTWAVDTTAPNTSITSGPSAITSQTSATFELSATEASSLQCKLDGAAYSACTSPATFAGLAAGSHSFSAYSVDASGNPDASPATWSWAIDITAPDTSISGGPSGTVAVNTASIAFSSPDTGATFECRLDGGVYSPCTSPANLTGLADGLRAFEVRARDAAGNADPTPASRSWTVDTTAPDTTISSAPAAATSSTSATFQFTASGGATAYECKLDTGAFAACTSPKAYSGLANAAHTFQVRAKDAVGNVDASPATWTWTVDTVAPDTTITGGPTGTVTATSATFTFTATQTGSTFECQLDSAAYAACVSPRTYTGIAKGNHTFRVRARDPAGNLDATPATRTWKIN